MDYARSSVFTDEGNEAQIGDLSYPDPVAEWGGMETGAKAPKFQTFPQNFMCLSFSSPPAMLTTEVGQKVGEGG